MFSFLLKRFLVLIPLLLAVTLVTSVLMTISPGDVLTKLRASKEIPQELIDDLEQRYSLVDAEGEPTRWYVRYGAWLRQLSQGDLGQSIIYRISVVDLLAQRVWATFLLSLTSITFAWLIAVPLGVLAAIYKDSIFDRLSALLAYAALSIPEFFLAIIAIYFAAITGWFPVGGRSSIGSEYMDVGLQTLDYLHHLILPTVVLGIGSVAGLMRVMRAKFIDEMRAEYVNTAYAKGLKRGVVMFKHALRNAINPLITYLGFAFSTLLSGSLLVENVMNYPGLGQLVFQALLDEDEYVVMAALMLSTVMLVFGNTIADLFLGWSDPRIRLTGQSSRENSFSPARVAGFALLVIAILGGEILFEMYASAYIPAVLNILKWVGIIIVSLLGLGCVGLVLYMVAVFFKRLIKPLCRSVPGVLSVSVLFMLYFLAAFADFIAPYSQSDQNLEKAYHPPTLPVWTDGGLGVRTFELVDPSIRSFAPVEGSFVPVSFFAETEPYKLWGFIPMEHKLIGVSTDDPSARVYPLGSDATGRCVFSRLLYGARISLTIGLIGISITMVLGFVVGGLAGYFGGAFDFAAMRLVELLMSIPALYLLLALRSALFEPGLAPTQVYIAIIVILSVVGWAGTGRIIRGMSLSLRNRSFVLAAESMGQSHIKILFKHILPNLASYLLVAATLSIPGYILGEAALSFLGLGISEPSASWGLMLRQAQTDMAVFFLGFWWLLTPGFAILVTVVAYNVLGDVLRDIVDPKMQTR
ncbi:MAG: ABC transporter permease subunit [Verrucomicrobiota bacterium]